MDARAWDARYAASELVWSRGPNAVVAAECAELPAGRAVDLGAGEGRNARWLASRGWQVSAVDFSPVALAKGRRLVGPEDHAIEWICADAVTWRSPHPVDLVVIAYLHLPRELRRAALRNALDALAPGGTLLGLGHDSTNLTEGVGGPQDPDVLMTSSDILDDLEGRRFVVERAERISREVTTDEAHRGAPSAVAYDCVVRVARLREPSA